MTHCIGCETFHCKYGEAHCQGRLWVGVPPRTPRLPPWQYAHYHILRKACIHSSTKPLLVASKQSQGSELSNGWYAMSGVLPQHCRSSRLVRPPYWQMPRKTTARQTLSHMYKCKLSGHLHLQDELLVFLNGDHQLTFIKLCNKCKACHILPAGFATSRMAGALTCITNTREG